MEDLAIKNGLVVTPQGTIKGGLTVSGGTITRVGADRTLSQAKQEIDAEGNFVIPGMIDPHSHLGTNEEERFRQHIASESASAALGGITTMFTTVRFGNMLEPRLPMYRRAKEIAGQSSFIDFKFNAFTVVPEHLEEIPALLKEGVTTYKFIMGYKREEAAQIGLRDIDWGFAYRGFQTVSKLGPPAVLAIHCEEPEIGDVLKQKLVAEGRQDLSAWAESRPGICEAMHVYTAGLIARELGTSVYIVHVSARESVDAISYLKKQGIRIYAETCPHYLVETSHAEAGIRAKVSPPLREKADNARLWQALADGTIDNIGTDHVASTLARKGKELWAAVPGFGGFGAALALLVSEGVNKGLVTMERLVKLTSENTARIFSIYPKKGVLSPGSDADIVILDIDKEWVLTANALKSASDFSIYEGRRVKGKVMRTLVRGELVAESGELVAKSPYGHYVYPN